MDSPSQFTLCPVGQLALTYIVAEGPDGMYLIDQRADHERVAFEQILAERSEQTPTPQDLLTPATVQLTIRKQEAIAPLSDLLASYGFEWEPFGDDAILLRAMPATLKESEAPQAFLEVLDERSDPSPEEQPDTDHIDTRERHIAATIACRSTVRAGQTLSLSEMESMIALLRASKFPHLCPMDAPPWFISALPSLNANSPATIPRKVVQ